MTIHPHDEADNLVSGDILFRYELTALFPAYVENPDLPRPGLVSVMVDAEPVNVIAVAQITGSAFQAFWIPAPSPIQHIAKTGFLIRSETVARRLFPALLEYTFKGK